MKYLTPKKSLGQHFLNDTFIAQKIVASLRAEGIRQVVEVGPGMGALTGFLLQETRFDARFVEVDADAAVFLEKQFPEIKGKLIYADFLEYPLSDHYQGKIAVIGNFPYNISTQILFKILEHRSLVVEVVGMLQKEVAERIAASPGSKTYGITSVLLQAFYNIEYLFTVHEDSFSPPPKVKSGVIRLTRNSVDKLPCNEKIFTQVVKTAFNQRRKMLSNSLKSLLPDNTQKNLPIFSKRPEQLSVQDFIELTQRMEEPTKVS
ncbi:MAG: 16S rRNA (adenine(1518)-N(6)/adenine(1519)-N(6))-dimethyltransferase RsmA [Bacteroidales bacterium]|jgi:16S rRNA (adenine1518-N6/adenine1519-N6)-dimethyltransferase|nr:16S rRNA (adenine(1518)-N(6)/adenine(1519)-N(6))-dimethyltransferase RsmA [Bacteroidales bacterium]